MKQKNNILYVLEATIGGTRRHLRDLATGMIKRGYNVHIAYSDLRDKDFYNDICLFKSIGISCTKINMRRGLSPISDFTAILKLHSLIKTVKPDIIHLHSTKAGFIGRMASIGSSAKVIYTPHCFAFEMDSPFRMIYKLVEKFFIAFTDHLIAVCEHEAKQAYRLGYPHHKVSVIFNGINISDNSEKPSSNCGNYNVVFIGRNCRQKGLDVLLPAFKNLKRFFPNLSLAVMSDVKGTLKNEFETAGATILPFGTSKEVANIMIPGRILVMPSRWEAFPYLLLEALSHRMAIVATDVGGVSEIINDRQNGLLIPCDNAEELAMAIQELLVSDNLRYRLTLAAQSISSEFSYEAMLDMTEKLYAKVL